MTNFRKVLCIVMCMMTLGLSGCSEAQSDSAATVKVEAADSQDAVHEVTFVELGSKNCIPCKMMQPVMEKIEKDYAGKVKVVFHDVWTPEGRPYARKYGIKAIPTQVFLDKDGKEFYRHTGFLAENLIVDILEKHGMEK